jgi:hypothetical protein
MKRVKKMDSRTTKLFEFAEQIENFKFCSPSDDPDEQDAVVYGFKHLTKRFVGCARKIQNQGIQDAIKALNTDVDNIYGVLDLHANLQVIIDDLRELLTHSIEWSVVESEFIDSSIIESLQQVKSKKYDLTKVIEFCQEINSTFNSGQYLATTLLIRALINHIPPIFGFEKFNQVVAQSTKSRRELFRPLDETARDVADLHTHDTIRSKENLPTKRQLEPFKPNVELLLQEILTELHKQEA